MISTVRSVGIYVSDQDRARDFFVDTMGFELIQDTPMSEGGARWIEVRPAETHRQLADRGVGFVDEPRKEFWGLWATFKDPDGNTYGLGQTGD